jgi:hypothetical protein
MKHTLRSVALLALAGLALTLAPSRAQAVNDWVSGDLLIGFRASGGQGSTNSLLINIGSRTNYFATATAFNLSVGNIGADLSGTYGTNWFSRPDLFWGIFGATESVSPLLLASRARIDGAVVTTPWPAEPDAGVRTITKSEIVSVTTQFNLLTATTNSPDAALQLNTANNGSYNWQVTANSGTDFGSVSQWSSIEGNPNQVLDLWQISGTTTHRGAFNIDGAGQIAFVPEPSTYALLGLGALALVIARWRHRRRADELLDLT